MTRSIRDRHNEAMAIAEHARNEDRDNPGSARYLFAMAASIEWGCARSLDISPKNEPTRSILCRSAAWLCVNAEQYDEAVKCARAGLAGGPPADIESELREVLAAAMSKKETK